MKNPVSKTSALIIAALTAFLMTFTGSSINIALPSIGNEFQIDAVSLGWVVNAFNLATVVAFVPLGRLADIQGRRKILLYGISLYTITSLILAFTPSATALIALRTVQGIGTAMGGVTAIAIVASVFPAAERGKALGIAISATYIGLSLGPVLGGLLTENLGWRSIFIFSAILSFFVIATILSRLKGEWAEAKGESFDLRGSIIYGFAIVGLVYGFSLLPEVPGICLVVAGCLGMLAFVKWETGIKNPVLDIELFKNNRAFAFANIAVLMSYAATNAVVFLLSLYLQYVKGYSPQFAGLVLLSTPLVQAIFSPIAGRISDKVEPRIIASAGMAVTTGALVSFIFLGDDTTLVLIIAGLAVLGLGLGLFASPNTNAVMGSVEQRSYGVASAIQATMRHMGMIFSLAIAMLLFSIHMGRVEVTPEYHQLFLKSMNAAFIIFAFICLAGVFVQLAGKKIKS